MDAYITESLADFERKNIWIMGKRKMQSFLAASTGFISMGDS